MKTPKQKLVLKHVDLMNFTTSAETNLDATLKKHRLQLGDNECAILFSVMGNQAVFLRAPTEVEIAGKANVLYVSTRFKLRDAKKDGHHASAWWENLPELYIQAEAFGMDVVALRGRIDDFFEKLGMVEPRKLRSVG